jgi:hypothetical protein
MIGDPLLIEHQPITPPGVHHPNPVHDFVHHVLVVVGIACAVIGVIAWFWAVSPDVDCAPPTGPASTAGEDDQCLTPTP